MKTRYPQAELQQGLVYFGRTTKYQLYDLKQISDS